MSKTRLHVDPEIIKSNSELIPLDKSQINYLINVLRRRKGDFVDIFDGNGNEYRAVIDEADEKTALKILVKKTGEKNEKSVKLFVAVALPKGKKINLIIQKLVELGVCGIIPLKTKRTVVAVKDAKAKKEKWEKIAAEAAKQSGLNKIPKITEVTGLKDFLGRSDDYEIKLIAYEGTNDDLKSFLRKKSETKTPGTAVVLIGPEGGFDTEEVKSSEKAGFKPFSLGRNLLRCETAAIAAAAILSYEFNE